MGNTAGSHGRWIALTALAVPTLAGLVYLGMSGAPVRFVATNALALTVGVGWIWIAPGPRTSRQQRIATLAILAAMVLPLLTGPSVGGVARWLPLGPVTLHAGMVALPVLAVYAARDRNYAAPILLAAAVAAALQPDAASVLAVAFAAVALGLVDRDWKTGAVGIAALAGAVTLALRDTVPPQTFVEHVLTDLARQEPLAALALGAALVAGLALIVFAGTLERRARFALGASLAGFSIIALVANYPSALIGYGASPILGYGLALGVIRSAPG
jgi:hypothetical protein